VDDTITRSVNFGRCVHGIDVEDGVEFAFALVEEHLWQVLRWKVLRAERSCGDLNKLAAYLVTAGEMPISGYE
jgi:hypothetical protein